MTYDRIYTSGTCRAPSTGSFPLSLSFKMSLVSRSIQLLVQTRSMRPIKLSASGPISTCKSDSRWSSGTKNLASACKSGARGSKSVGYYTSALSDDATCFRVMPVENGISR